MGSIGRGEHSSVGLRHPPGKNRAITRLFSVHPRRAFLSMTQIVCPGRVDVIPVEASYGDGPPGNAWKTLLNEAHRRRNSRVGRVLGSPLGLSI